MIRTLIAIGVVSGLCFQNADRARRLEVSNHTKLTENDGSAKQQKEAARLWEQAIAAKGGRDRLYEVHNIVISSRGKYRSRLSKNNQVRREELLVFPNKYWFWDDYRPDVFGLRVSMYNYDTNMKYVISDSEPDHQPEAIMNGQRNKALRNGQLSFLLETKWLKPTIVKASIGRTGLRRVDIVQTVVEGERVDFAFDHKTHLPIRVSFYDTINGKTYISTNSFSHYVEVSGIKVPQIVKYDDGSEYEQTYRFNVEYNKDIFIKPPSIEAGPEAWRVAKR